MNTYNLLLVDDDELILKGLGRALEEENYKITTAGSGEAALEILNDQRFDLVLTDLIMLEANGLDVLKKAKDTYPDISVIILTGYGDLESAIKAIRAGADDYLTKPCRNEEVFSG